MGYNDKISGKKRDVKEQRLDEQTGAVEQKLRLLLDKLHGEEHETYDKLIKYLSDRCQVTILKKKPLELKTLTEHDVFLLISPSKPWEEPEVKAVRTYVESQGGTLVVITLDGRKPERLNKLLEPYGLSVTHGEVKEKQLEADGLEGSQYLLEDIKSLACGEVWGNKSATIVTSNEAEVVLQYKGAILGAKRSFGNGTVHLFTCLPVFAKNQLDQLGNRRFLGNLIKSLGWKPSNDDERSHYLISKKDVEGLIKDLNHENVDVMVQAVRALGELGDVKAIEQLRFCVISIEAVLRDQMDWHRYDSLAPVVAEALTSIGEPAIELLIKYLKDDSIIYGIPTLWALCDTGNRKATETVINWIFSVGPTAPIAPGSVGTPLTYQKEFLSPPDLIRKLIPPNVLPKLLGDYTDLILDIFAWELASYSEDTDQLQLYMSRCSKAIQQLCEIRTPISSNILHKILKIEKLDVTFQYSSIQSTTGYLDFKGNQQMAKDELRQRGNPRYDPLAYLSQDAWKI